MAKDPSSKKRKFETAEDAPPAAKKTKSSEAPANPELAALIKGYGTADATKKVKKPRMTREAKMVRKERDAAAFEESGADALAEGVDEVMLEAEVEPPETERKKKKSKKAKKEEGLGNNVAAVEAVQQAVDEMEAADALADNEDEVKLDDAKPKKAKRPKRETGERIKMPELDESREEVGAPEAKREKAKKSKKEKPAKVEIPQPDEQTSEMVDAEEAAMETLEKHRKKNTKAKKEKKVPKDEVEMKAEAEAEDHEEHDHPEEETSKPAPKSKSKAPKEKASKKGQRHIAFVGNLPFDTKESHIKEHFKKIPPIRISLMSDKSTGKFKGFGFLEWESWPELSTAFQLYHHSEFVDDNEKAKRQINVEISAGGGGNKENRKQKIKAKNEHLEQDRKKFQERKKKEEEEQKKNAKGSRQAKSAGHGEIHPSRMGRMRV